MSRPKPIVVPTLVIEILKACTPYVLSELDKGTDHDAITATVNDTVRLLFQVGRRILEDEGISASDFNPPA